AELQRVNIFLNNIWNHAGAIIIVCDGNGLIQFFNPAAEKALHYNADEVVNKHTLALLHDTDELNSKASLLSGELGKSISPDFEVLATLTKLNKSNGLEMHYIRRDG